MLGIPMLGIPNLGLFVAASLVLLLVPGPAVLYIVARSAERRRRAGLVSVAGIHVGTAAHIAAAVLGLSAIIATSATALTIVKLGGAAYLIYLGIRTLRTGAKVINATIGNDRTLRRVFFDGAIVNMLTPKTALFFLAFVPQFVDPGAGNVSVQLITLGAAFTVLGIVTDSLYAIAARSLGAWLRKRPQVAARQHWITGVSYIGLGVTAAAGSKS